MSNIADTLKLYLAKYPEEKESLAVLLDQLATGEDLTTRKNFTGHVTGSGIVLSPDRKKVLLIYHRFLQKWLQPGGHMEPGESSPFETTQREIREETGLKQFRFLGEDGLMPIPIDINSHRIPANDNKHEPAHWHHDFRYAFIAESEALLNQDDGVVEVEWVALDDPRIVKQTWFSRLQR
jgi:8-oxo-dGTP pyrophosphatase MutT (NUDIX family)